MRLRRHIVTVSAILALVGISGSALAQPTDCPDGWEEQKAGCFNASVSGGSDPARLVGYAQSFGSASNGQWYAQLISPGGASSLMLMHRMAATDGSSRPGEGTYPVADLLANDMEAPEGQFIAMGNLESQLLGVTGFQSLEGTVTITGSSSDRVDGTFRFRAKSASGESEVIAEGTFITRNQEQ